MSDHDKRQVLSECVKNLAQDDPTIDDYYFHLYSSIHGTGVKTNATRKYSRFFAKGDGTTDDKMRLQLQRAVEGAQRYREKRKEEDLPITAKTNAARPRKTLTLTGVLDDVDTVESVVKHETTLKAIEHVYDSILALESHLSKRPDPTSPDAVEWAAKGPELQDQLWNSLLVLKPVDKNNNQHPFVELLLIPKGMKVFARSWPQLNPRRRLTVLTRLFVQMSEIDLKSGNEFELFGVAVIQPLVQFIGESDKDVIVGLVDIASLNIQHFINSRVGRMFLTAVISRGEMIEEEISNGDEETEDWASVFDQLFNEIQPILGELQTNDDSAWHLLAALAVGSDEERQKVLVDTVRKQVFDQIKRAKDTGEEKGETKIASLNLFLNVMGLQATFDDIIAIEN